MIETNKITGYIIFNVMGVIGTLVLLYIKINIYSFLPIIITSIISIFIELISYLDKAMSERNCNKDIENKDIENNYRLLDSDRDDT